MEIIEIKELINKPDIALIIGNGINRYNSTETNSWEKLLLKLWNDNIHSEKIESIPKGISFTEFYDMIDIAKYSEIDKESLQKAFCSGMEKWDIQLHHKKIVQKIKNLNKPLLTTNFDDVLSRSQNLNFSKTTNEGFTDFYPWSCYYSVRDLDDPIRGFGIWHINGMIKYHRSIRLGLTHYMGCVEKARKMIHKGDETESLFKGKNQSQWSGYKTWLHIIFNRSLFIFGVGLDENELFLRWLLIERKKYFNTFPDRTHKGWYLATKSEYNSGKIFFLRHCGIEYIEVENFNDVYDTIWE